MQLAKSKRGAFTLIEVMVIGCVAIILMVLCVPSIREARASNMTQMQLLGLAINSYSDTTPPVVECDTCYDTLFACWGKPLVDVGFSYTVTDDQDPAPLTSVSVFSDEPNTGSQLDAVYDSATDTLKVRAERLRKKKGGDGRVYLIVVEAIDACGNVGYNCCTVMVPLRWNCKWYNIVADQAADAEATCLLTGTAPTDYSLLLTY
ncbi:type II secretion system GspH family protein [bacterium]|nr:type II secretion system GspH family protein [bacterium]